MRTYTILLFFILLFSCSDKKESHPLEPIDADQYKNFDLTQWTNYPGGNQVNDITRVGNKIWLTTDGNLVELDVETREMNFYNEGNSGLPAPKVNHAQADSSGNLWFGFRGFSDITSFNPKAEKGKSWTLYTESQAQNFSGNSIEHLVRAVDGGIWMAHRSRFAHISPNKEITVYDASYKSFKERGINQVGNIFSFTQDQNGNIWIASRSSHLIKFSPKSNEWDVRRIGGTDDLHFHAKDMLFTDDGTLWIATEQGIVRYKDDKWDVYNRSNIEMPDYEPIERQEEHIIVLSIDQASDGSIYAATEHGILEWDNDQWQYILDFELVQNQKITSLMAENNRLWVGTKVYGLVEMIPPGNKLQTGFTPSSDGWQFQFINCSPIDFKLDRIPFMEASTDGTIWVGNDFSFDNEVINYNPENKEVSLFNRSFPAYDENILDIATNQDGEAWFATGKGLIYQNKNGSFKTFHPDDSPLPDMPTTVELGNGKVYAGTNKGLAIYDGKQWTTDIPGMNIDDIALSPSGKLWVLSKMNVAKYNGKEWTVFNPNEGGIDTGNGLECIYVDQKGYTWVGLDAVGRNGLARITPEGKWESFGQAPGKTVHDLTEDQQGNLWMVSWAGGLNKYQPNKKGRDAWTSYLPKNSALPTENLLTVECGTNGMIWVGGREGGLTAFNPK